MMLAPWKESYDKPRQYIQNQRHHFANRYLYSQIYGFFQQSCTDVRVGPLKKAEPQRTDCFKKNS